MKNVLYISQLYHDSLFGEYFKCSKVALDYAANNLSRAILKGFRENNAPVEVLNAPVIGSFPLYYKKPFVKGIKINGFESISYCNLMYIKRSDIHRKMNKRILEWCAKSKDNRILFFYSYTHLPVIEKVKKYFPDSKVFLLAADLPEYMASDNGFITRLNNCMGGNKPASGSFFDYVDGYVLLSAAMKDRLPVGERPWIVIEGIYDPEQDDEYVEKDKNKVVLYTGNLGRRYGIVDLLEAFHGIDNPDYRLWICGNGDGREDVEAYARKDSRIIYKGMMPRNEVIKLQKSATLLVNPRRSNEDYTKYSFPSKTMEYMASGTPTLMAHLQCMPQEYDEHLFYISEESVTGLRKSIYNICEKSKEELAQKGVGASFFIKDKKMPKPQVKKIIEHINRVCDE